MEVVAEEQEREFIAAVGERCKQRGDVGLLEMLEQLRGAVVIEFNEFRQVMQNLLEHALRERRRLLVKDFSQERKHFQLNFLHLCF